MSITNNIRDAFTRVIETGAGAGYLIRDFLFGAPVTEPQIEPYTPPFTGGQCNIQYFVSGNARLAFDDGTTTDSFFQFFAQGPIEGITFSGIVLSNNLYQTSISVNGVARGTTSWSGAADSPPKVAPNGRTPTLVNVDFSPQSGSDDCGNLPNPNPVVPVSDSGLASSAPPDIIGDGVTISEGLAPLPAAGLLAAALAALRSALELAAIAEALADALEALKNLLKNKDDKDDKKNVKIIQLDLGLISRDGFLRLYPSNDSAKYQALYLDLQVKDIPRSFGKFFGQRSPNYFRFTELGYIAWVSPTFGVISVDLIRFSRVSLGCPDGAIGFFYHLGLNGVIKANATAFYEEELKDESE